MTVALFGQYLGRNIVRRATQRTLALPIELDLRCQAKVANFDAHFLIEENVSQLKVGFKGRQMITGLGFERRAL